MSLPQGYIIVTRPAPLGEPLCLKINAHGGQALYLPTVAIAPPKNLSQLQQDLHQLHRYDWCIFTSPSAVAAVAPWLNNSIRDSLPTIIAIGHGTSTALKKYHLQTTLIPDHWSSAGLLAMPLFHDVKSKQIAIIQGEAGNSTLYTTLTERGAIVTPIIAYQRILPSIPTEPYLKFLKTKQIAIIVITSGEGLKNLITLTGRTAWPELQQTQLLVISPRLQTLAKVLEFTQTALLAENASDESIINALMNTKQRT